MTPTTNPPSVAERKIAWAEAQLCAGMTVYFAIATRTRIFAFSPAKVAKLRTHGVEPWKLSMTGALLIREGRTYVIADWCRLFAEDRR